MADVDFYDNSDKNYYNYNIGVSTNVYGAPGFSSVTGSDNNTYYTCDLNNYTWTNQSTRNTCGYDTSIKIYSYSAPKILVELYVKDIAGNYYKIFQGESTTRGITHSTAESLGFSLDVCSENTWYDAKFWYDGNYRYRVGSVTIPTCLAVNERVYYKFYLKLTDVYLYNKSTGVYSSSTDTFLYCYHDTYYSDIPNGRQNNFDMSTISWSCPKFTCSQYAKIQFSEVLNSYKMELYKSTDNGSSWVRIYTKSTGTGVKAQTAWNLKLADGSTTTATFKVAPPVPAFSYDISDATVPTLYKAIYYGDGSTTSTVISSDPTNILDLSFSSTSASITGPTYTGRTPEKITITKSTITDLSRISFTEYFTSTNLPNTTQTCSTGTTEYNVQALDSDSSLITNLGSYFTKSRGSYEYRIYPKLDGSTGYVSSINKSYETINYVKSCTQLEMVRPIEMGSIQPTKIKLLINPSKESIPSGSTLKFYVANNGNDSTVAWEELPNTCVGTTANPDCDIYQFANETKTANTWKLMIKITADKGTATSEVKLSNIIAVINGGGEDNTRPSGFKYLDNVVLDAKATTVNLEVPQGYRKYKIIGSIINTNSSGNPYFRLNNLTSNYDTYINYQYSSSSYSGASATNNIGSISTNIGVCPQFELDLFTYNNKWYARCHSVGDVGYSNSHGMISISGNLTSLNIVVSSNSYPMQAGTEFTILGVD